MKTVVTPDLKDEILETLKSHYQHCCYDWNNATLEITSEGFIVVLLSESLYVRIGFDFKWEKEQSHRGGILL